jgi:hypothetical protein
MMKDRTIKYVQWGVVVRSGGYEGEGLWLMDFIYIYKIE